MTRAYDTIGGPINLVSHTGERVTEATFKGAPTLIYFGFTYCPDICPGTMVAVNRAYDLLPDGVAPPQTLLITVDPERDTPEAMAAYVETQAFPDNLVGLTGSDEQIREITTAYRVVFQLGEGEDYLVDHTSFIYLMDGEGRFADVFSHGVDPAVLVDRLRIYLDEHG